MPINPIRFFQLKIFSKTDFTDNRLIELLGRRPTSKQYSEEIQKIENISSDSSKKILEFIANYDNGFFLPERCDAYEPIKEKFDPYNLASPLRWLCQPGCAVYLKKIKPFKFEGVIENERIAPIWDDRNSPLSENTNEPYYLSYIWLHIDEKIIKIKSKDYFIKFFNKLYENINGEFGYIKSPEDEIILEIGKMHNLS
jgi:hypothetical protein